jgi:hypothetical protein
VLGLVGATMAYEQLRELLYALGCVAPSTGWHYLSARAVARAARTAWHPAPEADRHAIAHAFMDATGHPDGVGALMLDSIRLLCLRHYRFGAGLVHAV